MSGLTIADAVTLHGVSDKQTACNSKKDVFEDEKNARGGGNFASIQREEPSYSMKE